jgi:hypothetical protein
METLCHCPVLGAEQNAGWECGDAAQTLSSVCVCGGGGVLAPLDVVQPADAPQAALQFRDVPAMEHSPPYSHTFFWVNQ